MSTDPWDDPVGAANEHMLARTEEDNEEDDEEWLRTRRIAALSAASAHAASAAMLLRKIRIEYVADIVDDAVVAISDIEQRLESELERITG